MSSGPLAVPYAITSTPVDRSVTVRPSGQEGARIEARPDGLRGAPVGPTRRRRSDRTRLRRRGVWQLGLVVVLILVLDPDLDLGFRVAEVNEGLVAPVGAHRGAERGDPGVEGRQPFLELFQATFGLGGTVG